MSFFTNIDTLTVDPTHPVDLFQQIADRIRAAIERGELAPGEKLPGERDLARSFDVSKDTIRRALGVLADRGLLIRNTPRGTFVASPEIKRQTRGERRYVHAFFSGWDYFGDVLAGAVDELRVHGLHLLASDVSELTIEQAREYVSALSRDQVAGFLVYPFPRAEWQAYCRELPASGFPLVFVDKDLDLDVDSVMTDERAGARLSVRHLMVLGHRDVGYIDYPPTASDQTIDERRESFLATCADMGLSVRRGNVYACPCPPGREPPPLEWAPALRAYLSRRNRPTAVACYNDSVAAALWEAAEAIGLRVPDDLSIIGFDNVLLEGCIEHPLTTVDPRRRLLGACAGRRLAALIEGRTSRRRRHLRVRPRLVVRRSTGPVKTGDSRKSSRRCDAVNAQGS